MKAILDVQGFLKVSRSNGTYVDQFCPTRELSYCGTWCPLFGEVEAHSGSDLRISICQGKQLHFTEIIRETDPSPDR